ncbi:Arc family DNA-binding protein [Mycobacterium sp. Y57]|uniref:Arc family DNA-binding protein n=1 Tax=Mycolicibacterium xanthum TaxID=2796469 RepID=UPI001C844574|nr:Arc family DNA-binding protein [Mycolicibacterium xanthum]MBX7430576.1 Arc family DNA-binding protein [Mycolicibacterium xanthum]
MTQVTWRAPDELVERIRQVASRHGCSVNEYLTRLAQAATDPAFAGDDVDRLRERLALAGLLAEPGRRRSRPDRAAVARARKAAGQGTPLSDLVVRERG